MPSIEPTRRTYDESKLKIAQRIAYRTDEEYYKLHRKCASLKGDLPSGEPAAPALYSMEQVLEHVRMRERQILELREEIKYIEENRQPLFEEIQKIADSLGVHVVTTRSKG